MRVSECFEFLLQAPAETGVIGGVDAWWRAHVTVAAVDAAPVLHAVVAGFAMDRIGFAFASGYECALRQLLGGGAPRRRALCATEAGGNHPRAIVTRIGGPGDDGVRTLDGAKSFVTLGERAESMIVLATEGEGADGRPRLRAIEVPTTRDGVTTIPAASPAPFVPEIPHAAVRFEGVRIEPNEVLPGDGYLRVLKPFRTIEDVHVFAALLGHALGLGRIVGASPEWTERTLALIAAAIPLATAEDPLAAGIHRAVGGWLEAARETVAALESDERWLRLPDATRTRWARDRPLMDVAGRARAERLRRARERASG